MFHYNSNSKQKQFKFENDVLYVPLFLKFYIVLRQGNVPIS